MKTDKELRLAALYGDQSAFNELVKRHRGTLARIIRQYDAQTWEDDIINNAVSEVILQEPDNIESFLCLSVKRDAIDCIKHRRITEQLIDVSVLDPNLERVDTNDEITKLLRLLDKLPDRKRQFVHAYYIKQLTYDEIGMIHGVSRLTASRIVKRGLQCLRELFNESTVLQEIT